MPTEIKQDIPTYTVSKKLAHNSIHLEVKSISEGSRSDSGLPTVLPIPTRFSDPPSDRLPHIGSHEEYLAQYRESLSNPTQYWSKLANELLTWNKPFSKVLEGSFEKGNVTWFEDGELNASVNCVDRHAETDPGRVAIIFEANEPGTGRHVTYGQLSEMVNRLANVLLSYGLKKGDTVAIYLPMVPEALAAVLACTRIGVLHSLVFAGFSATSLGDRIRHSQARVVITSDEGLRGSKKVPLKNTTDEAVADCPSVGRVLVLQHTGNPKVPFNPTKDRWWHEEMEKQSPICPPVSMKAEDPLFILYTSGSTGAPKGVVHSTAGYLLGAAATTKYIFDCHPGDVFGCTADIGWITGHTYLTYGPLLLGLTTVVFESIPTYPDASRYWKLVQDHKITQFYTSPTAIRALRRLGDSWVEGHDLSSLKVIGSVGEPINPEAWWWYHDKVGKGQCALVDTYWQTETGSIIVTPLPAATRTKPGSASMPFFGIDAVILDPKSGEPLEENNVSGVLAVRSPWPSVTRTVYQDHQRYLDNYLKPYPGYYCTGDGASRDQDGFIWIGGRMDDVINVSGHRLGTAEIESSLILHPSVAETAVVGVPDPITGQSIFAFVALKPGQSAEPADLNKVVREQIGAFAAPKRLVFVDELPKTRSGKIIRRILRKVVAGEHDELGDLSTVSDPSVVDHLIERVHS